MPLSEASGASFEPIGSVPGASNSMPSGWRVDRFGRQVPKHKSQTHYMRSSARNPWSASPSLWENPINVARAPSPQASASPGKGRPVNRRNYWTPSHWVQKVEGGVAGQTSAYCDYSFTNDFNQIWKNAIARETAALDYHEVKARRTAPASSSSSNDFAISAAERFRTEYAESFSKTGVGQTTQESLPAIPVVSEAQGSSRPASQTMKRSQTGAWRSRSAPALRAAATAAAARQSRPVAATSSASRAVAVA